MEGKQKSGLATAGLVLGIIAICTSFIPIVNNASFLMGLLAIIFGVISLVKKRGIGKAIAALILGVLSIVITLALQSSWGKALDNVSEELDKATGSKTEEVLKNDADVTLGNFEVKEDEYGLESTKLVVTLKNKSSKSQNFSVKVEALDSKGTRIETDDAYFDKVGAGQSAKKEVFTLVTDEKTAELKKAKFKVVEVSAY